MPTDPKTTPCHFPPLSLGGREAGLGAGMSELSCASGRSEVELWGPPQPGPQLKLWQ